jgi:class 3 adenylate cyclase/tetratricopeptide (TPR) repeat protein
VNRSAVTRKLAAILIADVVGFSRLMERDDGGTFARLREIRERIVDPKIAEHGGRVVKTAGDGMLLEFGSADAALRCAIDVQRAMHADNQSKPLDQRIEFRIGINLGDIIVDGTDIAGDGVNVAARLEALAEPGGICVSSAVREQVHGSLDVGFDDIGEQQVKNIMRPIRVFAVALDSTTASHTAGDHTNRTAARNGNASRASTRQALLRPRSAWAVALLALVAIGLVLFWWNARVPNAAGPPAMSVGVLPLIAPIGNATAAQRADSLTRDLSAQLARADVAISVVPMTTRQGGPRNSEDIGDLARVLNFRYVLEGDIQPRQDKTELRLRLVNAASGEQIWNETVSLKEPATAAEQMRSSRTAMEHLRNRLFEVEMQRATVAGERATTPMDYVLRARAMAKADKTLERFTRQEALCEEALRLNPDFVPALLCVSYTLDGQLDVDSKIDRARVIRRMDEVTNRAVNLNRGASDAWNSRSGALMYMGRWDAALEANATAIQLDPDAAWLVAARAWSMSMVGRPEEAVALVAQAIAMDQPGEWWTIRAGCEAHLLLGQYEEAIATCERAAGRAGDDFDIAYFLAAAYAHTGATARAAEEAAKILRRSPGFTIATLRTKQYSTNPEYQRLAEKYWYTGLRKAGIPEQ